MIGTRETVGARISGLREFRYFHSVAHTGNFARAARALNIGQPNVSHQVQKLEQELGTQLLIRHGRGVTLTPAGSRLLERLDIVLGLLSAPLTAPDDLESATGAISLALTPECAPLLAPRLLERCRETWPGLAVTIQEGTSASLEQSVLDRRVDIAVLQDPPALPGLAIESVVADRLGLVSGPRTIRLDGTDSVRVRQLAGLDLVLPSPRHWIRRQVESAVFRRGIALERVQQIDGLPLIKEMVRRGLGHTILPLVAVRDEVDRGALAFHPIDHDPLTVEHAIVRRNGDTLIPLLRDVHRTLRDVMADLVRDGVWSGAMLIGPVSRPVEPVEIQQQEAPGK